MEKSVRKMPKEGRTDDFYVLVTEWQTENLSLTVVDNDVAWKGMADAAIITELCKALHKKKEDFVAELKHALSDSEKEFTFLIEEDNFIVKKIDLKSNIKVKFCNIPLKKIPSVPTYMAILSGLLDQEKTNRSNISKLTQEMQDLKAERKDFERKLQQFTSEKASVETILYSQFCEILNAKKKKIAYLESQIGASGNALSAESSPNINANEQTLQKNIGPVKRTNQNFPVPKRKCTEEKHLEEPLNLESNESSRTATHETTSAPELDNQNVNNYDSDTDIDTDDEGVSNTVAIASTVPSSSDTLERNSERILPRRACSSSILPKRVHNVTANDSRRTPTTLDAETLPSQSNREPDDTFNSQSLLDEY